jgi:putative MFS transporter
MNTQKVSLKEILNTSVIVAALGYFVDVYDLVLFLVIGIDSLLAIKVPEIMKIKEFQYLLNIQMIGMLLGGLFWGILGDKKGRLSVLFGSILVYSLANIANGFVIEIANILGADAMKVYSVLRFVAGFGLAGELGAGITLVSEVMSKENRGYGTMLVASIGVTGAVVAALVGNIGWQLAYFIGGGLGLSLLLLRIGVFESGIFKKIHNHKIEKGNFFALFKNPKITLRYLNCILIGLPVWFVIGLLIGRAPEFAKTLHVDGTIDRKICILLCYSGLIFGDMTSGGLSQLLKSRKKVFYFFYALCTLFILVYLNLFNNVSTVVFYLLIFALGYSVGFWAVFVTVASEQFGTNLRATVTTTVPNFVRGSLVPISLLFDFINEKYGLLQAGYIVTAVVMIISVIALLGLKESFGKELDYLEE